MIDTPLDETDIKKKLLEQLQAEMNGRRVSPVLSIDISTSGDDEAGETPADELAEGDLGGDGTDLEEPTDVNGRLGSLLKKKGMLG